MSSSSGRWVVVGSSQSICVGFMRRSVTGAVGRWGARDGTWIDLVFCGIGSVGACDDWGSRC